MPRSAYIVSFYGQDWKVTRTHGAPIAVYANQVDAISAVEELAKATVPSRVLVMREGILLDAWTYDEVPHSSASSG